MIPTEHEYTVATHAAAQAVHEQFAKANEHLANIPPWDALSILDKRSYLETVLPIVDAALSAVPDRLQLVRDAITAADGDPEHPGDEALLAAIKALVK